MSNKQQNKSKFLIDVHEQLQADEEKTFWELSPVLDTLPGRIASYVIFRCIGVDAPKYVTDKLRKREPFPDGFYEQSTAEETAELEFLNSWQSDPQIRTLQSEALAFRGLLVSRDFQCYISEALARIPLAQWDKTKQRFTSSCGNTLYITMFNVWSETVRGRNATSVIEKLPATLTLLERYILSRALRDYKLDDECTAIVESLKENSGKHGQLTLHYSYNRTNELFNPGVKGTQRRRKYGITAEGLEYYKYAAVYCGLWSLSLPEPEPECEETFEQVMASSLNMLIGREEENIDRLRSSFYSDWMNRKGGSHEDAQEVSEEEIERSKELASLKSEIQTSNQRAVAAEKALEKQTKRAEVAEEQGALAKKRVEELETKLKAAEKKLAALSSNGNGNNGNNGHNNVSVEVHKALEEKVNKIVVRLDEVLLNIDDLYSLLEIEDGEFTEEYDFSEEIDKSWDEEASEFKGRLLLYGGFSMWRERVKKWFEAAGVKVRVYEPGDILQGVRETDYLFLNVIGNKHKWSVPTLNAARSAGAKVRLGGVNNLEQTLRLIFEKAQR